MSLSSFDELIKAQPYLPHGTSVITGERFVLLDHTLYGESLVTCFAAHGLGLAYFSDAAMFSHEGEAPAPGTQYRLRLAAGTIASVEEALRAVERRDSLAAYVCSQQRIAGLRAIDQRYGALLRPGAKVQIQDILEKDAQAVAILFLRSQGFGA
jgi:hypothetical protein